MSVFNDGGARPRSSSLPAAFTGPGPSRELLSLHPDGAPVSWQPVPLPALQPKTEAQVQAPDDTSPLPEPPGPKPATIAAPELGEAQAAAVKRVRDSAQALETALRQGVDVARKNFVGKLCSVAAGSVMLGLAIAATVATGGAAAPLVAFTGLRLLMSVADARAARECVKCAEANLRGENRTPPTLGPNALGNWLHGKLKGRYGDDKAKVYAAYGSTAVALGLFALTAAIKVPATAAKLSVKAVKTATLGLMALVWGNDTWVISKGDRQRVTIDEARQVFREAERALRDHDPQGLGIAEIRRGLGERLGADGKAASAGGGDVFLRQLLEPSREEDDRAIAITPAASQARAEAQEARGIGRGVGLAGVAAALVNDLNDWLD